MYFRISNINRRVKFKKALVDMFTTTYTSEMSHERHYSITGLKKSLITVGHSCCDARQVGPVLLMFLINVMS